MPLFSSEVSKITLFPSLPAFTTIAVSPVLVTTSQVAAAFSPSS